MQLHNEPTPDAAEKETATFRTLVEAIVALARDYEHGFDRARVEQLFGVRLIEEGRELVGKSTRWPVVVSLIAPRNRHDIPPVRLTIKVASRLTLADLEHNFGKPSTAIKAKESIVEYDAALRIHGLHIMAFLLGGVDPSTPVLAVELSRTPTSSP
jgi:hypothetical protein